MQQNVKWNLTKHPKLNVNSGKLQFYKNMLYKEEPFNGDHRLSMNSKNLDALDKTLK